jgi:hypothetical protein
VDRLLNIMEHSLPALRILRKCENLICVQVGLCRLQGKTNFSSVKNYFKIIYFKIIFSREITEIIIKKKSPNNPKKIDTIEIISKR